MPWVALGDFLNEWFDYSKDQRALLVADAIPLSDALTPDEQRWAAFSAATAEWLCAQYQVPCPAWVHDQSFVLPEPWFDAPNIEKPEVLAWLMQTTPPPFTRRHIFCGDRMFHNKYDFANHVRQQRQNR